MNDVTKKKIGQRINEALAMRDKKQKELAQVLNVTDNTISYFCSGRRVPNIEQIIMISQYLNVSADYLLGIVDTATTNKDLRFVCEYTGLSETAIKTLHSVSVDREDNLSNNELIFLNILIINYGQRLSELALKYLINLQKAVYKKEMLINHSDNISTDEFEIIAGELCHEEAISNLNLFLFQNCAVEMIKKYSGLEEKNNELEKQLKDNHIYNLQKIIAESI